ncbi:sigma-70 family RNA polymerase sigma factor [Ramlibacter sp.]|uniref:sigma-70 family RNA polymerase sigma factor n=1 Tax=Ramlibacter sp. TaxID=1917967 RepID=UPI002C53EFAA|nr:sigma-70 family RNA polymerase sigma factor [Ramlibacter sp.]HWI83178.1 sigma-70 family RNA polymerase sigma factor [Ramlibacter sp.]
MADAPPATSLVGHIPDLRRYARALTGDGWSADDLVQDTLERACERWQLWAAGSDLRAWLFTLMHNLFIDGARRAVRQQGQRVPVEDVGDELVAPAPASDQSLDLQRCLMRLPEAQREVLLLVSLEDLGYEEVARITGVPVGTVMSRLSRARGRLRELMDGSRTRAAPAVAPLRRLK